MQTLNKISLVAVMWLALTCNWASGELVYPIENAFVGDDPTESFSFETGYEFHASQPSVLVLEGVVTELDDGSAFLLSLNWQPSNGGRVYANSLRFSSPPPDLNSGPVEVSVRIERQLGFTSTSVGYGFEGLGGSDDFRFIGTFTYRLVPEPAANLLMTCCLLSVICVWRDQRKTA